jgi:hypothetical protein
MITQPGHNENPKSCSKNSSSNIGDNFTFCPFSEATVCAFVVVLLNSALVDIKYFRAVSQNNFKLTSFLVR